MSNLLLNEDWQVLRLWNHQTKGNNGARQTRDTTTKTWIAYDNSAWRASKYKGCKLHQRYILKKRRPNISWGSYRRRFRSVLLCPYRMSVIISLWLVILHRLSRSHSVSDYCDYGTRSHGISLNVCPCHFLVVYYLWNIGYIAYKIVPILPIKYQILPIKYNYEKVRWHVVRWVMSITEIT